MAQIGLILIIAGWVMQLNSKKHAVDRTFVTLYSVGVLMLVVDGLTAGLTTLAALNLISFVLAIMVLRNLPQGKK